MGTPPGCDVAVPGITGIGMGLARGGGGAAVEPPDCGDPAETTGDRGDSCTGAASSAGGIFTLPQGLVGANDIFGFGGSRSGLAAGCGTGRHVFTVLSTRGIPSCTNQQSFPKLQWPFRYRSHGRVPMRSGRLFFPKWASSVSFEPPLLAAPPCLLAPPPLPLMGAGTVLGSAA